jgi:hypothetical protein
MPDIANSLREIYAKLFLQLDKSGKPVQIKIEFYPYTGINSRVRLRDGVLHVKISDILRAAPLHFHESLAEILLRKLFRKRVSAQAMQNYRSYTSQPEIRHQAVETRRARGRKVLKGAQGEVYDLDSIFDFLNQLYFRNAIEKPALTWSAAKTYRILGHHDSTHQTIAVSRSLDDKGVPRFVVEYVVYHEMLHIKHPTKYVNGRRYMHTPEFKRDEQEFAFFDEAEDWIERNIAVIKTKAGKKPTTTVTKTIRRLLGVLKK